MFRKSGFVTFVALLFLVAGAASAQTTLHVIPGANAAASGTNLLNALAGIVGNSSAKPFVLKLDPGIYDVGATPVAMKPFVDIEGSGQAITTIRGVGNNIGFLTAVVLGASNSELRHVKVQSVGRGFTNSIAVLLNNVVNASVRDATLLSNGASAANWGLRNLASTSSLQNLTLSVGGGSQAYGIACTGASGGVSRPAIRRAVISVANASSNHGIFADQNAAPSVRDVEIQVTGGSSGFGLRYSYGLGGLTGGTLEVTNSKIVVSGGTSQAIGIEVEGTGNTYNITHSNISAAALVPTSVGIRSQVGDVSQIISVDHCDVGGATNSIAVPFAVARVGASRLAGAANIGAPACAATFNGSYVPLNGSCL